MVDYNAQGTTESTVEEHLSGNSAECDSIISCNNSLVEEVKLDEARADSDNSSESDGEMVSMLEELQTLNEREKEQVMAQQKIELKKKIEEKMKRIKPLEEGKHSNSVLSSIYDKSSVLSEDKLDNHSLRDMPGLKKSSCQEIK